MSRMVWGTHKNESWEDQLQFGVIILEKVHKGLKLGSDMEEDKRGGILKTLWR